MCVNVLDTIKLKQKRKRKRKHELEEEMPVGAFQLLALQTIASGLTVYGTLLLYCDLEK